MISVVTFFVAGLLAWAHYASMGRVVIGSLTVWICWYAAVLIASGIDCARARDRAAALAWTVMAFGFAASMMAWDFSANPLLDLSIKNLVTAALILACSTEAPFLCIAAIHLGIILAAFMTQYGWIPGPAQRPRQFLAYSYPDIAATARHVCLLILGLTASGILAKLRGFDGVVGSARPRDFAWMRYLPARKATG